MSQSAAARSSYGPWFLNPYLFLGLGALLASISELLLRHGADATKGLADSSGLPGVSALASWWVWLGILTYILSFVCWLHVLRFLPLHIAFALMSVTQVLVALGAWTLLGEGISAYRWCGIALVLAGIGVIAQPLMRAEERL